MWCCHDETIESCRVMHLQKFYNPESSLRYGIPCKNSKIMHMPFTSKITVHPIYQVYKIFYHCTICFLPLLILLCKLNTWSTTHRICKDRRRQFCSFLRPISSHFQKAFGHIPCLENHHRCCCRTQDRNPDHTACRLRRQWPASILPFSLVSQMTRI